MSNEPNDTPTIDPNTDNLEDFDQLFHGRAKAQEVEEVEPDEVEPVSEDEEVDAPEVEDKGDDEAPDGDDDPEPKPKPKKVNRVQERINELTAKAREAERALEALRAEQAQKQTETAKQPAPVVQDDTAPNPDEKLDDGSDKYPLGEFDPAYIRDMARHTIDKEWAARKEQEAQEASERQINEARTAIHEQWVERLAPVTEQHEDYIEKTLELESAFDGLDAGYSDYLVQTIKSLDHGPEVLYYFANNLEEAQKFVKMGPLNATLALGEINAMFKGNTRKEAKVSKAPPPPQVNKGSKTRVAFQPDTDNLDDFSEAFFKKPKRS